MSKKKDKAKNRAKQEDSDQDPHLSADAEGHAEPTSAETADASGQKDPLDALREERDQLHNQLQRTLADLQNFRKRRVQEMADARRSATEALVGELLPVLDNFHLATDFDASNEDQGDSAMSSMREGLLMVRSLLEGVFERHGVVEIQAAGAKFDPSFHEAVGVDPNPEAAEGVVSQVMQRGYTLEGRILRPSRVMVGGAPQAAADEPEA